MKRMASTQPMTTADPMSLSGPFWTFANEGREFTFTNRDLKQPWRNYLANDRLQVILTHTGVGPSHGTRSQHSDYLTWTHNPRTVFIRDRDAGTLWHLNGTLGPAPADWRCTHGFGYTTLSATQEEVAGELTFFLPPDDPVEIWRIKLTNRASRTRRLQVVPLTLWRLAFQGNEEGTDDVKWEAASDFILARCLHWWFPDCRNSYPQYLRDYDRIGFMAASLPIRGFDCMTEPFVGDGSLAKPDALTQDGKLGNRQKMGTPGCGALELHVDLAPNETAELVVLVGQAVDRAEAERFMAAYNSPEKADAAFARLHAWWEEYRARQSVSIPAAPEIAEFANGWNRYALWIRHFNRFGYRDTAQDMVAYAPIDRERGRRRLELMYPAQHRDGWTWHDVETLGWDQHRSINGDVPAWMPWATAAWVRETGDFTLLEQRFPFADGGPDATAYDHCKLALERLLNDGKNSHLGLPMLRSGDWNDCFCGSSKRGVSVWLAEFLVATLNDFAECASRTGRTADAAWMRAESARLSQIVTGHCWNGEWYVAAFDDDHHPMGCAADTQGRIFLNPQTWAVLSGIADAARGRTALASVERLMDTPVGIPLIAPPYTQVEARAGLISRMAPGHHHNGGSWNHAVTWAILAECKIGRPDRALELYRKVFPPALSNQWPLHISEPYVHTSYTNTPASGETGRTGVGWNTGTVCWIWRVLFEGFAGVEATWDGLRIDPRLPKAWDRMSLTRRWRDTVFQIEIEDPKHVQQGVARLEVDGQPIHNAVIPGTSGPGERRVRVVLGGMDGGSRAKRDRPTAVGNGAQRSGNPLPPRMKQNAICDREAG